LLLSNTNNEKIITQDIASVKLSELEKSNFTVNILW